MSLTNAPRLETENLVLRGPEERDFDAFAAFFASDRSRAVGGPLSRDVAWRTFGLEIGHWHLRGFGYRTVTRRDEDTPLGMVGCWFPEGWPEREIGWMVYGGAEGRGVAFEAAQAARSHAFGPLGWTTAVSYIDEDNARSIRLAERLGAVRDAGAARPGEKPRHVYRHSIPEALR